MYLTVENEFFFFIVFWELVGITKSTSIEIELGWRKKRGRDYPNELFAELLSQMS